MVCVQAKYALYAQNSEANARASELDKRLATSKKNEIEYAERADALAGEKSALARALEEAEKRADAADTCAAPLRLETAAALARCKRGEDAARAMAESLREPGFSAFLDLALSLAAFAARAPAVLRASPFSLPALPPRCFFAESFAKSSSPPSRSASFSASFSAGTGSVFFFSFFFQKKKGSFVHSFTVSILILL